MHFWVQIIKSIQRLREEAEKKAAEEAAMNAPTEKDMINDIRENRRRERRQVNILDLDFLTFTSIKLNIPTLLTGASTSKYI